jgi:thioredoxin 1
MPIVITTDNIKHEVEESTKPVIIDVYASWCGPCQMMDPIIKELELELGSSYKFAKINVDESRELAIKFGVSSIPTFIFIKDNEIKGKKTGYMSKDDLIAALEEFFG